ncbi:MAG: sulfatase [Bryobacterales bacterium]|nr:sulfatase [Bryobacterales bacterium]
MNKREFLSTATGALWGAKLTAQAQGRPPNVVLIYADDLGYGDLGCYGSRIPTPYLDHLAANGARFTNFYSASPVCSPSRAALLTGRYPTRSGVTAVLMPDDRFGLPATETTIAQTLKPAGYRTMCVGKWHLGSAAPFLPTNHGFDEYYGVPYSNDMWPLKLLHNTDIIEDPTNLTTLAERYTGQAVNFINRSKSSPFFLYLAHHIPHIPLTPSEHFKGASGLGPYGDSVAELDWSVGQVLRALAANRLSGDTLVMFASDNGPWFQGSTGRLQGRKGGTFEGGVRVPFIARFPRRIPRGQVCQGVSTTMDILPTVARLAGAPLPAHVLDGVDIWPMLTGETDEAERDLLLYFDGWNLQCARSGKWKLHVSRYNSIAWTPDPPGGRYNLPLPNPELYDLAADPEESYDTAGDNPQIAARIRSRMEELLPTFPGPVMNAWLTTMSYKVQGGPAGALPVRVA